jgi:hypothetical protein
MSGELGGSCGSDGSGRSDGSRELVCQVALVAQVGGTSLARRLGGSGESGGPGGSHLVGQEGQLG